MKKIVAMVCGVLMLSLGAAVPVKQGSKAELCETYFRALVEKDYDALWELTNPAVREQLVAAKGSKTAALDYLKASGVEFSDDDIAKFKVILQDPALTAMVVDQLVNKGNLKYIKIDGKWFLNFGTSKVDHSSKAAVAEAFLRAMANGNGKLMWECMAPANKAEGIKLTGSEENAVLMLYNALSMLPQEQKDQYKSILDKPILKNGYISEAIKDKDVWVNDNGNWYLDMDKMNKK